MLEKFNRWNKQRKNKEHRSGLEDKVEDALREQGFNERAIFVVDKKGVVRYIDIHDIDEQPDNEMLLDVLRDLD